MNDDKPVAIVLPNWDPNEPRFVVEECLKCSDDRQFKNGRCVYNQRLGFCYSVDEIVEVLNNTQAEDTLNILKENINEKLEFAEHLQKPFHRMKYGEDKGYWRGYVDALKETKKVIE